MTSLVLPYTLYSGLCVYIFLAGDYIYVTMDAALLNWVCHSSSKLKHHCVVVDHFQKTIVFVYLSHLHYDYNCHSKLMVSHRNAANRYSII